jgi:RimJ/RimL family protein N-acetyltransferase
MDSMGVRPLSDLVAIRPATRRDRTQSFDPREGLDGVRLGKDAWGLGYATEALNAIVLVAEQIRVKHLHAVCHVDHRASAHVLEKCGFTLSHITQDQSFPNLTPSTSAARYYARLLVP